MAERNEPTEIDHTPSTQLNTQPSVPVRQFLKQMDSDVDGKVSQADWQRARGQSTTSLKRERDKEKNPEPEFAPWYKRFHGVMIKKSAGEVTCSPITSFPLSDPGLPHRPSISQQNGGVSRSQSGSQHCLRSQSKDWRCPLH